MDNSSDVIMSHDTLSLVLLILHTDELYTAASFIRTELRSQFMSDPGVEWENFKNVKICW